MWSASIVFPRVLAFCLLVSFSPSFFVGSYLLDFSAQSVRFPAALCNGRSKLLFRPFIFCRFCCASFTGFLSHVFRLTCLVLRSRLVRFVSRFILRSSPCPQPSVTFVLLGLALLTSSFGAFPFCYFLSPKTLLFGKYFPALWWLDCG